MAVWKVIGASVTGRSHEAAGKGCEDASGWRTEPALTCLAVADGAGSRPMSGRGAALAVGRGLAVARAVALHPASRSGRTSFGDPAASLRLVFADVREQIAAMAAADGNDADDYATTLAVAILAGDVVSIGQIGDTIAVVGRAGGYQTVAPAPRGEYANETRYITGPGALDGLRVGILPAAEVDAVFLSTHGLRSKILGDLAAATPFMPFFEDLAGYARSPTATVEAVQRFLAGLDDQSGDDKTLVAAVWPRVHN